ncbi:DnaA regulatory inactivator Hda [Allopusillimonas ginsengisoli]|uniref:DnaA regulatory inactivator Hda n=1 Tax=Allopusillimonas ginsengisoli TaxID=453575 RepID=UPI00101EC513|nr:DnaA regulatory inactivator Hda [Allopusillimonas ginsengisoli]TEA80077.1 DnaA regulatory inactivator Hda [Allopusillimonas ginsengisoli]
MTQQLILDLLPPSPPSLENFVAGQNAAVLHALAHCTPGHALYLWGAPGAGRSHLLQAVAQQDDALYVGPDGPAATLSALASADTFPYRLVSIDNVELMDERDQTALFALYNRWREVATTNEAFAMVLAGDRAPLALPLREDLRTRLGWDLVYRLELLSDDDRAQALETRASERGLRLAPEVVNWILTHYSRDMRLLSALLEALDRYSIEKKRAITVPLLKDLLASGQPAVDDTRGRPEPDQL